MSATIPLGTIDGYARLTQSWDADSKKELIVRLLSSIGANTESDFSDCFGAWQDTRDAEEIVREIYENRRNKRTMEEF